MVYNKEKFIESSCRNRISLYRCINNAKCQAKIKFVEKLKFAEIIGKHDHKLALPNSKSKIRPKPLVQKIKIKAAELKSALETPDEMLFNKDVTTDVELVTNDRDVSIMFLKGFKFTKYFESKTHVSYRCVHYTKQTYDCQARIKHNTEYGEVWMRSEHNHAKDDNAYDSFLQTAAKVRKFTKKTPRFVVPEIKKEPIQDIGTFALEMTRKSSEKKSLEAANDSNPDESLLVEMVGEKDNEM